MAAVLLRQVPQHQNQDMSVTKISAQSTKNSRPGLRPTAGLWASAEMSWYLRLYGWKKYTAPMVLIQAQTEDLVSVRALKNFAGKINRQGKTTCDYIHMIGTKHEIYESRGKILEKYWGYMLAFLDDEENDTDRR